MLGFVVSGFVFHAGWEISAKGLGGLLQKSLGTKCEAKIHEIAHQTFGVFDLAELKTFRIGGTAILIMKVFSRASSDVYPDIKHALVYRIIPVLEECEFKSWEFYIRFYQPGIHRERVGYALKSFGDGLALAPKVSTATHILISDTENGKEIRSTIEPIPGNIPEFLIMKHISEILVFGSVDPEDNKKFFGSGLQVRALPCYRPESLGV